MWEESDLKQGCYSCRALWAGHPVYEQLACVPNFVSGKREVAVYHTVIRTV